MSIASKVNLLIAALAVMAAVVLTVFVGQREYAYQRDALVLEASSLTGSQPHLQLTFYFRDPAEIRATLDAFMALSPAVKRVAMFDTQGELIDEQRRDYAADDSLPGLSVLREGVPPLDAGIVPVKGGSVPESLTTLSTLTLGEQTSHLSFPVTSVVNPGDSGLQREDFAAALAYPELVRSNHVAGYIVVCASRTVLMSQTLPAVAVSAGTGLLVLLLFWFLARFTTRRITAPLAQLATVADDIAAGKHPEPVRIRGSGEIRDIAEVLNGIISGLHKHTQKLDTDRKILTMKVDERTEQLSQHKQELVTAEQKVNETRDRLRHAAYFDALTSLPNRKLFTEQLTLLLRLAQRSGQNVGLLHVDIDNFKRINDSLGAKAGDALLREVSLRLAAGVRESDVLHRGADNDGSLMDLSRLGGDEFTVVLNHIESNVMAERVAERLAQSLAQPYRIDENEIIVTATIGIALAPEHAADIESLVKAASTAMITAKKRGRNRILVYDDSMAGNNRERLLMENDLRKAVELDQLVVHYQPQVNAQTGVVSGVESLVRWNHPQRGLIPPFKWIPIAEELGIIEAIGAWVLHRACNDLVRLHADGYQLPKVSVNVSALQFREELIGTVKSALGESGLSPDFLQLEMTEGIMISNQEAVVDIVQRLKALGIRLSIDDFGTGYSSLSYLTRFPLNELKIDRSFVLGLSKGQQHIELVRAIIAMGKSLGLEIVVEGVEHAAELMFFREQDVEIIQGFLFSQPVPLERLQDLLSPEFFLRQLKVLETFSEGGSRKFNLQKA